MWVLPVGTNHVRDGASRDESEAIGHGHRSGDVRKHLPLRNLRPYPRRYQARRTVSREEETVMKTSRRRFLQSSGALVIAVNLPAAIGPASAAEGTSFAPNAYIRIDANGRVTMTIAYVEMGQGTYTSIPMLIAEELEVPLSSVRVEHAPADE